MSELHTPTNSPWSLGASAMNGSRLNGTLGCDVCVVGGGIAGLTTAYLLAELGHSVVLLEAGEEIGSGETAYTTAHLAWILDDRYSRLKSIRGADVARAAAASHLAAIDLIEELSRKIQIDCEFRRVDGVLFAGTDYATVEIDEEHVAMNELGLPYQREDSCNIGSYKTGPCLRFSGQGQFHPIKYLAGLTSAFRQLGGVIHVNTRVDRISGGALCHVRATTGTVNAKAVVVATGSPFDAGVTLHTKLAAYTTYAIGVEVPRGSVVNALYWDTEDPYHYIRVRPGSEHDGNDLLIVGGEDHKTGQASDQVARWERLLSWTRERIPGVLDVRRHWSGQVFETPDGLGLIGHAPWGDNIYVITGDSGMGLTHGTLGARLITNLIGGKSDPLMSVYDPNRWMPGAIRTLLAENFNVLSHYTDWLTGGDVSDVADIPPGHGAIVRSGLSKRAVYKDKLGVIHELSAACPHMGCAVRWNPGENTWDCPCHGSRFRCTGEVIHGPAVVGLKSVPVES